MKVESNYEIGEVVYLKTDKEQLPRIVTGFLVRKQITVYYLVHSDSQESPHYEYEFTREENTLIKLT